MKRSNRARRERAGVALVYAVFGAFVAASMVTVMFTMAGVSNKTAQLKRAQVQARYLAEGAVELGRRDVQAAIANFGEPTEGGEAWVGGIAVPYTIEPAGQELVQVDAAGFQSFVQPFEVASTARVDGYGATVHRLVHATSMPLFQFAVFYTGDLEVHPGPDMTLGGRVHTNSDMYLGGGSTLTLDTNYVRAVGEIRRRRKISSASGGTVQIRQWVANPYDPSEPREFFRMNSASQMGGVPSVSGYDSAFTEGWDANGDGDFWDPGDWLPFGPGALEYWGPPEGYDGDGHTVLAGEHGVGQALSPDVGSIGMYDEAAGGAYALDSASGEYVYVGEGNGTHDAGYYHAEADLKIVVSADGTSFTATNGAGLDVTQDVASAVTLTTVPDMRQSNSSNTGVGVVQVDVGLLAATGAFPANGLLYAGHHDMGNGTDAKGLLLTNGAEIAGPLTAVSEGSVYVHGDYNTTAKKGASVIGDAVNLLSNAWDGSKGPGQLPTASETTFNVAMLTGNSESTAGSYNGGFENLPRFHERWSGVNCNISGSFVCPWESRHATGAWRYGGDRYTAPRRNWEYDTAFNSFENLPPYTPMGVLAREIVSW